MVTRRDELGLRSETVRRANLSAIARELHALGPLSRSELGSRTGLTRSAIRALIGEFVNSGLVSETETMARGTPGRPSALVVPRADSVVALGLEIAVDSIAAAVVGFGGRVMKRRRVDRRRGPVSIDETAAALYDVARSIKGLPDQRPGLVGVGVAVVGVVRRSDGQVSMAPNLGWRDVALGDSLRRALGTRLPVSVANEADLGALAELRRGAARGMQHLVFISGEVGVGGGIIMAGQPMTGVAGYGGEIGHMSVNPRGRPCQCGSIGCWETEVGEDALLARAGYPVGGGREAINALLAQAASGDVAALEALEDAGHWLGRGIGTLVNILNPELIVLGGLLGRVYPVVSAVVDTEIERHALAAPRGVLRVVPAALGEDAPILGGAELAFEPYLADPARWLQPRAFDSEPPVDSSAAIEAELASA